MSVATIVPENNVPGTVHPSVISSADVEQLAQSSSLIAYVIVHRITFRTFKPSCLMWSPVASDTHVSFLVGRHTLPAPLPTQATRAAGEGPAARSKTKSRRLETAKDGFNAVCYTHTVPTYVMLRNFLAFSDNIWRTINFCPSILSLSIATSEHLATFSV